VVGSNNGLPISYNRGTGNCTLTCHQVAHNSDGSISTGTAGPNRARKK
jgi:hypothetical protein